MAGTLILVVGPSGVGKDTLLDGARQLLDGDSRFHFLRRDITRPGSAGGEDHNPVSEQAFARNLEVGRYPLHWGAHHLRYGLPVAELAGLERGQTVIANGSRSVLAEARARFERLAIVSITANEELLRGRLLARGRENGADIESRIARAKAFEVTGEDVFTIRNDGDIEEGIALFVEALAHIDGRVFGQRPQANALVPRRGAYLVCRLKDEVLFVRTKSYDLPGGGLEDGESPVEALRREVREETGFEIIDTPVHLNDASVYSRSDDGHAWHKLKRFFVADVKPHSDPTEPDHTPVWIRPTEIWDELAPDVRFALIAIDRRAP